VRVRTNSGSRRRSHDEGIFETRAPGLGGPSPVCMVGSICFHAVAIIGLTSLSLYQPPPPPPQHTVANIDPTVIRIGDKLFFVQRLAPREDEPPKPKPAEQKQQAAKATRVNLQAPATAATQAAAREAPKVFVPPEIKRNLISESTLIQPMSPPDLVPPNTPLPSFRVFTAQIPKVPRPFIVPGRRTATPPDPTLPPPPPPPNIDLASAAPALNPPPSRLVLPPAPSPVIEDQPPKLLTALPPSRVGDPANILSLSDRPVAPSDKLVVPPGNVLGATGDGVVLRAGTVDGDSSGAAGKSGDGRSNGPGGTGAAASGSSANANGGRGGSSGNGSPGSNTPGSASGGVAIIGAGSSTNPPIPKGGMQRRASNGTFDAVVVQSSSTDPFPESKELLTGRPIYTVYVALGTPKDWALYFCVPGEKDASPGGNVVKMGTGAPVQAPYPTTLVRPDVAVPSFYRQVLVHGYVTAAGKVESLKVVRPIKPETDQALLAALARWDFRPATRAGVNIGVEFVISIPVAGL
jgi:TonB family protein